MKTTKLFLLLFSISAIMVSCSKDDSKKDYEFKDQNLAGKIEGTDFTFGAGTFESNSLTDDGEYWFNLYNSKELEPTDTNLCDMFFFGTDHYIIMTLPNEVGLYELSLQQSITLVERSSSSNIIVTTGAVEITSATATEISGQIDAEYDGDNFVNGKFTVDLCSDN